MTETPRLNFGCNGNRSKLPQGSLIGQMAAFFERISVEERQSGRQVTSGGIQTSDEKSSKGVAKKGAGGRGKTGEKHISGEDFQSPLQSPKDHPTSCGDSQQHPLVRLSTSQMGYWLPVTTWRTK